MRSAWHGSGLFCNEGEEFDLETKSCKKAEVPSVPETNATAPEKKKKSRLGLFKRVQSWKGKVPQDDEVEDK